MKGYSATMIIFLIIGLNVTIVSLWAFCIWDMPDLNIPKWTSEGRAALLVVELCIGLWCTSIWDTFFKKMMEDDDN